MSPRRLVSLLAAALVAVALAAPVPAVATDTGAGPVAQSAAKKKCKKSKGKKRKCKRKKPNPGYYEGQPCDPAKDDHYAKYGFLCLPQPQPDGSAPHLLVRSRV